LDAKTAKWDHLDVPLQLSFASFSPESSDVLGAILHMGETRIIYQIFVRISEQKILFSMYIVNKMVILKAMKEKYVL
jgi:hypothetical protein